MHYKTYYAHTTQYKTVCIMDVNCMLCFMWICILDVYTDGHGRRLQFWNLLKRRADYKTERNAIKYEVFQILRYNKAQNLNNGGIQEL